MEKSFDKYSNLDEELVDEKSQLNLGSLKNNWLISKDENGCPLHKYSCKSNICSELNDLLLKEAIKLVLRDK